MVLENGFEHGESRGKDILITVIIRLNIYFDISRRSIFMSPQYLPVYGEDAISKESYPGYHHRSNWKACSVNWKPYIVRVKTRANPIV